MPTEVASRRLVDPVNVSIGERMRALRRKQELSLQQVADAAEVSIGFLSHVERGLSSPSVRDLLRIAAALDVDMSLFFEPQATRDPGADPIVVRVADRQEVSFFAGVIKQRLTPSGPSSLQVYMITLEPGGRAGDTPYTHGGEEAGVVLQGRVRLTVEDTDFLLEEGDSFRFLSNRPHRFSNAFNAVTRVVWVNVALPEPQG